MSVNEALRAPTIYGADLDQGLETISLNQTIRFEPYVRLVLPLDGYVFWVKASSLSPTALINAMGINVSVINQAEGVTMPAPFTAKGSLHYRTDSRQTEEANYASNMVTFSSMVPVQNLNEVSDNVMYMASFDGPDPQTPYPPADTTAIKFSFSARGGFYQQAGLYHYTGNAVYSTMQTQIVDDPRTLATSQLIVSNSLPAWLNFAQYDPPWPVPVPRPLVPFYPSMLVPDNLAPPYVAVHISPDYTEGVQTMPRLGPLTQQYQLASDRVVLTLYGCNNDVAQSLLYSIEQYSYDTQIFGILNIPVVRDDKEGQNEMNVLAQKKRITFDVSYNQVAIRDIARQLIKSCVPSYYVGDTPVSAF